MIIPDQALITNKFSVKQLVFLPSGPIKGGEWVNGYKICYALVGSFHVRISVGRRFWMMGATTLKTR
jgi:hypothetical protein